MLRYDIRSGVKKIKTKTALAISGVTLGVAGLIMAVVVPLGAHASGTTIYTNIPSTAPGNVPSVSFEATGTSEFGGQVSFAGTARTNPTVTVLMSSWGCQTGHWTSGDCTTTSGATFSEPITLNVYNVGSGNSVGSPVTSVTQTFIIPFRPSADPVHCTGPDAGKWFDGTTCFNGLATPISFSLTGTLPDQAIVSVAYNTSDYGAVPQGHSNACNLTTAGCGYDSLNVGTEGAATVGAQPTPDSAYQLTQFDSCTNGAVNPFGIDSPCWTGFQPAFKVEASPSAVKVQIFKYVDGVQATAANANNAAFPMLTTFTSPNLGNATDAPFTLSPTPWSGIGQPYEADFIGSVAGADYTAHEVTTGNQVVGASCADGKPFALQGYTVGDTLAQAQNATKTLTAPTFTDLQSDHVMLVWNKTCPQASSITSIDQCKNGGWSQYFNPTFKNQGDCVSWVQHNVNGNGIPAKNR